MEFEKRKAATLAALGSTETDKSPKGSLDTPIIPLINAINLHPSYFTTSSCSGRISILSQPTTSTNANKKARGGSWLFISHDLADSDSVVNLVYPPESTDPPTQPYDLVFRFEPLIIAVECKDIASAQSLVSLAISSGFRESGITNTQKRVIIAIRCSIRLEVPLGYIGRIMVSPEYVRYLVELGNEKMEANRKRTDGFFRAMLDEGFLPKVDGISNGVLSNTGEDGGLVSSEAHNCIESENGYMNSEKDASPDNSKNGSLGAFDCSIPIVQIKIVGEPIEKLYLWSHSACTLPNDKKVLIFGGFGGIGRHARRNDCLKIDPLNGSLEKLNVEGPPSPRMGHTSSLVGDCMYVIGGRSGPSNILNDVWVFYTSENKWRLLEFSDNTFPARHRHAATVVGSSIYIFGGLHDDIIYSSLHVLDTDTLQWQEIYIHGEWPSARHSHSLVVHNSHLYMFGGYNGKKALDDFYSFDLRTNIWKKENTIGRTPYARFSHSMFVYKHYLGIIGGCPPRQHCQELSLLNLQSLSWRHVILNSDSNILLVCSTANIVGDDLVIIGGGSSCYAFGTKFSEPMIINMLPFMALDPITEKIAVLNLNSERKASVEHWVVKLERKYAKLGKDILKKFGWLDLTRKVYTSFDRTHICFPITEKFRDILNDARHSLGNATAELSDLKSFSMDGVSSNDLSSWTCLKILKGCGVSLVVDEVVELKKSTSSPLKVMTEGVASLIEHRGLAKQLLEQLPTRWERLGDIVVLPLTSFKDPIWDSFGEELWNTIAKSLGTRRLARQGRIASTGTRDSTLEILIGDNGWVEHRENGIIYSFDATKCMFSWGNLSEKLRIARLNCKDEVVVDLFAGIGYFVLPFLVGAKAKLVIACEWNPHAIEALRHNIQANSVSDRCVILEGDNRITAPKGVADRVSLGLLPTSEGSWVTAVRALRSTGGTLHVHANVKDSDEESWTEHVSKSIHEIARSEGHCWDVSIEHVERVKWYAPHIRHLVADVKCKQAET